MGCGGVIPAAGSGSRLGNTDKTMIPLAGAPVLEWVLRALIDAGVLSEIVIATSDRNHEQVLDLIAHVPTTISIATVPGGDTRQESVRAGVNALSSSCELVLVHDAARPLVSPQLIFSAVQSGDYDGAVVPGVPVTDTIKRVSEGHVLETLERSRLVAVQTPQVFRRDWLVEAYRKQALPMSATDEASILEFAGFPVHVIPGEPENIKVTTPSDVVIAEALLVRRGLPK
jgi:2-C-methyl-D-erythritol 4-phosphate cytidylyltransferase